jgi:HTH-type transcriptional regulator/antitoxin HigA
MRTRTLDRTKYAELLAKTLPHTIHNDRELDEFTQALLELDEVEKPSREERELADLLITLIEQYEQQRYAIRKARPLEMIEFLLDQRGLSQKDLWPIIGSKGITSEVMSGKRGISINLAAKLGDFFHIDPALFVEWKAMHAGGAELF